MVSSVFVVCVADVTVFVVLVVCTLIVYRVVLVAVVAVDCLVVMVVFAVVVTVVLSVEVVLSVVVVFVTVVVVAVLDGGVFAAWHPVSNDKTSNRETSRAFIGVTSSTVDMPQSSGDPICASFRG